MPRIVETRIANSIKQYEESSKENKEEILKAVPQESFEIANNYKEDDYGLRGAKQALISKNIEAYRSVEEGKASFSKEDNSILVSETTVSSDELAGVKEENVEDKLEEIRQKVL